MLRVGVVGCGYWGPNLVRNFMMNPATKVVRVADLNASRLESISTLFPSFETTTDAERVLAAGDIDLVAIATPVSTHFALASRALEAGKHVLLEKPLTASVADAEKLIELADRKGVKLFVDHTFLFTGAVRRLKEMVAAGELGEIMYYDSTRINLGLYQSDVSVIWDIGPHDLSIVQHLLGREPDEVLAVASCQVADASRKLFDIAYLSLRYGSTLAHLSMSWLAPVKVRQTIIGGTCKMAIYDDLENVSKLQIYDCGAVNRGVRDDMQKSLVEYRRGDMYAPKIDAAEALRTEIDYIVRCLKDDVADPINGGRRGMAIVRTLAAAERSAHNNSTFQRP